MFFAFGHIGNATLSKRFDIHVQMRERAKQYRHMSRLDCHSSIFDKNVLLIEHVFGEPASELLRLGASGGLGIHGIFERSHESDLHTFILGGYGF